MTALRSYRRNRRRAGLSVSAAAADTSRRPRGLELAIQTGLLQCHRQTVFVQEDDGQISPNDIRRLWALRHDDDLALARSQRQPGLFDPDLVERLSIVGPIAPHFARRTSPGGIQMIRRDGRNRCAGTKTASSCDAVSSGRYTTAPTAHL